MEPQPGEVKQRQMRCISFSYKAAMGSNWSCSGGLMPGLNQTHSEFLKLHEAGMLKYWIQKLWDVVEQHQHFIPSEPSLVFCPFARRWEAVWDRNMKFTLSHFGEPNTWSSEIEGVPRRTHLACEILLLLQNPQSPDLNFIEFLSMMLNSLACRWLWIAA